MDLDLTDFHPVKIVDLIEIKLTKYCQSKTSTPAGTAIELKANKTKLCNADTRGLTLAARDIMADSVLNFGKIERQDIVSHNIAMTNLEAIV